jgi:asparagine N-glycosylation enzyme membrane subunit Stt3
VWFILIVAMSIGQRRWGYYAAAPIGILAAAATVKISSYLQKNLQVAAAVVIAAFLILPNIRGTTQVVQMPVLMNADWYVTLTWLKQNTPDPFPSDDYYYTSHDLSVKPSYGILSWWDYGHWVIEIAHRVPIDSPTQVSGIPSQFLTATTEEEANTWLPENVPYVIIDETLLTTKWPAVLVRAEKEPKPVTESFLYTLWTEQAQTWTKIYERNGIKVYKRSPPGDYLMQGIKGELYICDKEIFEATYEWVEVNK